MRTLHWGLLGLLVILLSVIIGIRSCAGPVKIESGFFAEHRIYTGPRAEVWTARFSPGDSLIAAACVDSTLRVWRADGTLVAALTAASGLTCAEWEPGGQSLAATAYDGAVYRWSWPGGKPLQRYSNHEGTAWTLRFSPDGSLLASAGEDGFVIVRDIASGTVRHSLRGHERNVWDIAFTPDGKTLASGSFDNSVVFWNTVSGAQLRRYSGHSGAVVSLAFSADGRTLASSSDDKTVQLQDVATGKLLRTLNTPEHQQSVSFSQDGKWLITSGRDKNMMGELL
ncbi:MAG: WD40 repeat domain-containing protein, partial [Chitinophagaceae bacterium]